MQLYSKCCGLSLNVFRYNDVGVISETWFKKHHDNCFSNIDGYNCYRRDRINRRGGGVAIYIKSSVDSEIFVSPFDDRDLEVLWIKTRVRVDDFYMMLFTTHPRLSIMTWCC